MVEAGVTAQEWIGENQLGILEGALRRRLEICIWVGEEAVPGSGKGLWDFTLQNYKGLRAFTTFRVVLTFPGRAGCGVQLPRALQGKSFGLGGGSPVSNTVNLDSSPKFCRRLRISRRRDPLGQMI
uniref:Uncharacterized protein n=1 Tax=Xenopus tropicalis TaxID=8364 RepID=A0A1B8XZF7_XENTR